MKKTMRVLTGCAAHTRDRIYSSGELITGDETELKPYLAQLEEIPSASLQPEQAEQPKQPESLNPSNHDFSDAQETDRLVQKKGR